MSQEFDRTDYSVVVKHRAAPPNPWRWEIYRAGRTSPVERSSNYFESRGLANSAGQAALATLLDKLDPGVDKRPAVSVNSASSL
jgi:hypothetical protein